MSSVHALFAITLVSFSVAAHATPWVNADDRYLRTSITLLADAGYIRAPVNTYPLMWLPLMQDLAQADTSSMSDVQLLAYLRVQAAAGFAIQSNSQHLALSASNRPLAEAGTGQQYLQKAALSLGSSFKGDSWAIGVSKQFRQSAWQPDVVTNDSEQPQALSSANHSSWDGSYAAYTLGNWVLSASQQNQWWGPAKHSSFMFNNLERPTKTLAISRLNSLVPLHHSLDWLGPVNVNVQVGEYASQAVLSQRRFVAARLDLRPIDKLQLGLSSRYLRHADAATSSNPPAAAVQPEASRVYALDLRYSLSSAHGIYTELSRQQAAEQQHGWLVGTDYQFGNQHLQLQLFAEYQRLQQGDSFWQYQPLSVTPLPLSNQWQAGLNIHTPSGKSGYVQLSRQQGEQSTGLTAVSRLSGGYQQALLKGLLSVDYQLSRQSHSPAVMSGSANSNDNNANNSTEQSNTFEHTIAMTMQWRW